MVKVIVWETLNSVSDKLLTKVLLQSFMVNKMHNNIPISFKQKSIPA